MKILSGTSTASVNFQLSDELSSEIANILQLGFLSDDQRKELDRICDVNISILETWEKASRPKDIREILKKIEKSGDKLRKALEEMHSTVGAGDTVLELLASGEIKHWVRFENNQQDLFDFQKEISKLQKSARESINQLPNDTGGRNEDFPLTELINQLGKYYKKVTGNDPVVYPSSHNGDGKDYSTLFFLFAEKVYLSLVPYGYYPKSNQGLGKFIQNALRVMTESGV